MKACWVVLMLFTFDMINSPTLLCNGVRFHIMVHCRGYRGDSGKKSKIVGEHRDLTRALRRDQAEAEGLDANEIKNQKDWQ